MDEKCETLFMYPNHVNLKFKHKYNPKDNSFTLLAKNDLPFFFFRKSVVYHSYKLLCKAGASQ